MDTQLSQAQLEEVYPEPKGILAPGLKNYGRTREEQIKINKNNLEFLQAWREQEAEYTEEELEQMQQTWEMAKIFIDSNRSRIFP